MTLFAAAVFFSAFVAIAAHYFVPPHRTLIYIFKPLTTLLILAIALLPALFSGGLRSDSYAFWIVIGLVFSLAGDVLLMLPSDRFVEGLVAFLLAHISYIIAFRGGALVPQFPWVALALLVFGAFMLAFLWRGLAGLLKPAVTLYVLAILVMAALAVSRALNAPSGMSILAAVGAPLFVASDALLATDRFRKPFHLSRLAVLGTYFAGQLLIAFSAAV